MLCKDEYAVKVGDNDWKDYIDPKYYDFKIMDKLGRRRVIRDRESKKFMILCLQKIEKS